MKKEKPAQVIPCFAEDGHKTETRVYARNIRESWCIDKKCKFYNQPAVQGHCHTTKTFCDSDDWSYLELAEKSAEQFLEQTRDACKGLSYKKQIRRLESEIVCLWTVQITLLDELVRLRAKNAAIEHECKRLKKRYHG